MKNFMTLILLCLVSNASFSQNENKKSDPISIVESEKTTDKPAGYPIFKDTGNPVEDQKRYDLEKQAFIKSQEESKTLTPVQIQQKINQIDSHINSINIKSEYILKNPSEKKIAEEKGWFIDMDRIKKELEAEKIELQKALLK